MKITLIQLLIMIASDKAPSTIKYKNYTYNWLNHNYYRDHEEDGYRTALTEDIYIMTSLNAEIEIITK